MQLRPEQLPARLERGLAPIYLVSGDEPLQVEEALDRIRATARSAGFGERTVLDVDAGFDWGSLGAERDTLSLFAERRVLDLRMPTGKPGDAGSRALVAFTERIDPDTLLVVSTGQLEARVRRSKWYAALERAGVAVQVWPIEIGRLPQWIRERAGARGWRISDAAAEELAVRAEGNLLACAQEIELLGMLCRDRPIDLEAILAVAADSARYDAFDLVDATLEGDAARTVRILRGLAREGEAPSVVAGTVAWEVRSMAGFAHAQASGQGLEQALAGNPAWSRRRGKVGPALARHPPEFWYRELAGLRQVDAMAKGAEPGDPWEALLITCTRIAGLATARGRGL